MSQPVCCADIMSQSVCCADVMSQPVYCADVNVPILRQSAVLTMSEPFSMCVLCEHYVLSVHMSVCLLYALRYV